MAADVVVVVVVVVVIVAVIAAIVIVAVIVTATVAEKNIIFHSIFSDLSPSADCGAEAFNEELLTKVFAKPGLVGSGVG